MFLGSFPDFCVIPPPLGRTTNNGVPHSDRRRQRSLSIGSIQLTPYIRTHSPLLILGYKFSPAPRISTPWTFSLSPFASFVLLLLFFLYTYRFLLLFVTSCHYFRCLRFSICPIQILETNLPILCVDLRRVESFRKSHELPARRRSCEKDLQVLISTKTKKRITSRSKEVRN